MAYQFATFDKKAQDIQEHLARDFAGLRTGRATATILDSVTVESYGTRVSIQQLAGITIEDPRTLRIAPWDAKQGKEIEKAILAANLGLSVGSDERGVRVFFPELTTERREGLVKIAKGKLEEARTSLRALRDEIWSDIQAQERSGTMTEDDKFRNKEDMQKRVDAVNAQLEAMFQRKEQEFTG